MGVKHWMWNRERLSGTSFRGVLNAVLEARTYNLLM